LMAGISTQNDGDKIVMACVVAIGGGELRDGETRSIDKYIVDLAGRAHPHHLFIPTASKEPQGYIDIVKHVYGDQLGCECDSLCILGAGKTADEIEEKIAWADIVYVGGGNTRFMMEAWARNGIDEVLKAKAREGMIVSGLSAGSICWFESGISDSEIMDVGEGQDYVKVSGLGLLPGCHSPHLDVREREEAFDRYLRSTDESFLGIENNCAIVVQGSGYRIIRSRPDKNAYVFRYSGKGIYEKILLEDEGKIEAIERLEAEPALRAAVEGEVC